jgi:hypothetical protein
VQETGRVLFAGIRKFLWVNVVDNVRKFNQIDKGLQLEIPPRHKFIVRCIGIQFNMTVFRAQRRNDLSTTVVTYDVCLFSGVISFPYVIQFTGPKFFIPSSLGLRGKRIVAVVVVVMVVVWMRKESQDTGGGGRRIE